MQKLSKNIHNYKWIRVFKDANDKGNYDPNFTSWTSWEEMLLEGQLQMVVLFVEVLKPRDPIGPNFSRNDNI